MAGSEVRWRVAGRDRSSSFMTRALADSYRASCMRFTCTASDSHDNLVSQRRRPRHLPDQILSVTMRDSERLYTPSAPPGTLSAICP
jgi:hypothetical protein